MGACALTSGPMSADQVALAFVVLALLLLAGYALRLRLRKMVSGTISAGLLGWREAVGDAEGV